MSQESSRRMVFDPTGKAVEVNFGSDKPKHWWEDLKELSQVVADVSVEAFNNIKYRIPKLTELIKDKISEKDTQENSKSEIKRVFDVSHGKGSLKSRNELKGRPEAHQNFGQRKKVTEFNEESNKIRDTSFYQRGEKTGDEKRIRETVYRSKEEKDKSGTILTREKDRVIKRKEDGTERIVSREDGKIYSEIITIDENGNKVSEGKKIIYPKQNEIILTEAAKLQEEKENSKVGTSIEEISISANELYSPLWKKNSENKVKELLSSQEFKEREALLLLRISELIPQIINIEELRRAGLQIEEIQGICNSYAEGMLFGLMMRSAPVSDEKMGPFIDLLSQKLGQYKDLVIDSGVLKRDISTKDKKSTSTKKKEAVESTADIAERLVRFHEIMSMYPGAQQILNRYANMVDTGLSIEPVLEASIQKDNEKEKTNEYFTNRVIETLSQTFPCIELNSQLSERIVSTLLKEFKNKLRYDFITRNGLETPIPIELFTQENAINLFNEFLASTNLNTTLEFELSSSELQGLSSLRKTFNLAREIFIKNFGIENVELRDIFIRESIKKFIQTRGISTEKWPIAISDSKLSSDFITMFEKLSINDFELFSKTLHQAAENKVDLKINETVNPPEINKSKETPEEILKTQLPRLISDRLGLLQSEIYNERQIENLINFLISQLPKEDLENYFNGKEVRIENILLMADIQLEELIASDKLLEILSPPTVFDKVVRFAESRKTQIVRAGAVLALLTILTQSPLAGAARKEFEGSSKKVAEITQEVDSLISDLTPLVNSMNLDSPETEKLISVFENSSIGLDKNLIPQLELKLQSIIAQSLGTTEGLPEKLLTAYAEISANGLNFGVSETTTLAGMHDGLGISKKYFVEVKPNIESNVPPQVEPTQNIPSLFGNEIVTAESVTDRFIFVETSGDQNKVESTFDYKGIKYTVINSDDIKNSSGITKENIYRMGIGISNSINSGESVFIFGNSSTGYRIITAHIENSQQTNVDLVEDNQTLTPLELENAKPTLLEGSTTTSESIVSKYSSIHSILGEMKYQELTYNPEIRSIDISGTAFEASSIEGGKSYRQVIEESTGDTDGQLKYVYQSGLGACSISARTSVVGDLLGQEVDTYDLGHYINSFYGDLPYERSMGERDILRLIPEDLRPDFLNILQELADAKSSVEEAKEKFDFAQTTGVQVSIQQAEQELRIAETNLSATEEVRDSWVEKNVSESSMIKLQAEIRKQFVPNQANALDAIGIDVSSTNLLDEWRNKYGAENIGQGKLEAIPNVIINDAEDLAENFLTFLQENTSPTSRVVIDSNISAYQGETKHAFSVVGVNVEEGYFLIKDTNGFALGADYFGNKDTGLIPTISPIGEEGIFKISLKVDSTDANSAKNVARTLISFYNTFVISKY